MGWDRYLVLGGDEEGAELSPEEQALKEEEDVSVDTAILLYKNVCAQWSGYNWGMGPGMMSKGRMGGYGMMGPGMMGYGDCGMMGYGHMGGYGMMGQGHMGGMMGYGGYGMRGYDAESYERYRENYKKSQEEYQKYLDETSSLRKKLHNKKFDYYEAIRNPDTKRGTILEIEKEIRDLQWQIYEKSPR